MIYSSGAPRNNKDKKVFISTKNYNVHTLSVVYVRHA